MARLPNGVIVSILNLQQQLLERLDEATRIEFTLLERFGETEETLPELEELQTLKERANTYYARLSLTLRRICEAQPLASRDMLTLLTRYIDEAESTIEAIRASIRDIKNNWYLS